MKNGFLMVFVCMIFTAGAVFDGLDNQDMTEPTIHFGKNPMKYNTYAKGQCTYYVFDRVKEDHHLISNQWGDAKHWANKAKKQGIQSMKIQLRVLFYIIQKENMDMLLM